MSPRRVLVADGDPWRAGPLPNVCAPPASTSSRRDDLTPAAAEIARRLTFECAATPLPPYAALAIAARGVDVTRLRRELQTIRAVDRARRRLTGDAARAGARTGGNQTKAAALLSIHRDQIRYRTQKFGLKR